MVVKGGGGGTEFWKSYHLASCFAGFVDPVDGSTDGFFEVEPAWFGIDRGGFVLFEDGCHFALVIADFGLILMLILILMLS